MDNKCSNCKFAILVDFGYSNYTVEGTTVYCSKNLHPDGDFDRWYGEDKRDLFANECGEFDDSEDPARIDCDREDLKCGLDISKPEAWSEYSTNSISEESIAITLM